MQLLRNPMKKVLYTDFEGVESVISSMMDNPQLKKAITKTNLYSFWDKILPEKFKGKSKPYSMLPGRVMVVACENPVVAQELSLHKIIYIIWIKFSAKFNSCIFSPELHFFSQMSFECFYFFFNLFGDFG